MTTQKAIKAFADSFTTKERDGKTIFVLKDDAPEECRDFIRELHNGSLPDDSVYSEIRHVADHLADYDEPEDGIPEIEAEPYNRGLMEWLSDNPQGPEYMEKVVEEDLYGIVGEYSFFSHVMAAQCEYRQDIGNEMIQHFELAAEEIEEEA